MVCQQLKETRLLEHRRRQIQPCTYRIHCQWPKLLRPRHTFLFSIKIWIFTQRAMLLLAFQNTLCTSSHKTCNIIHPDDYLALQPCLHTVYGSQVNMAAIDIIYTMKCKWDGVRKEIDIVNLYKYLRMKAKYEMVIILTKHKYYIKP